MKRLKHFNPTEHAEQVQLIAWADGVAVHRWPGLRLQTDGGGWMFPLFAVPNGAERHPAVARKLKAEGVRAGVPDLMLLVRVGDCPGLVIELKRRRDGRVRASQHVWLEFLAAQGFRVAVCRGAQEAIDTVEAYLSSG